jgi:hypothetical protein
MYLVMNLMEFAIVLILKKEFLVHHLVSGPKINKNK